MKKTIEQSKLAQIQYNGMGGITSLCLKAIARLIHFGDRIHEAKLLSYIDESFGKHCFIFTINNGETVAIKSGFSSGYPGEGPSGLVKALQLLERHDVEIDEYNVSEELLERADSSCLLLSDIESLNRDLLVSPQRWYDYIPHIKDKNIINIKLRDIFPAAVPFNIIDTRLIDLALQLDEHPDNAIASGYRRLEDLVRDRTSLKSESGSKLFSKSFQGDKSILYWDDHDGGEHSGKGSLFTSIFKAYRNRRAHKEFETDPAEALREFLLINELFILESKAVERPIEKTKLNN